MAEVSYLPIIEDMRWSYSRLGTFDQCPYQFFLKHICKYKDIDKFYASYGSFIHKIIERYYRGEIPKEELESEFLINFSDEVKGTRPKDSIVSSYIDKGALYFSEFEPFPYECVEVEKKVIFDLGGYEFIGFIDYLGKDENGDYIIIDNKSRNLKPRSKRKKPTLNDKDLDKMLRQLYLYAGAIKQEYGKFPVKLCFNCFKAGVFIEEAFDEEKYNEAVKWAVNTIELAKKEEDWDANLDYFFCRYICGVSQYCVFFDDMIREMRKGRRPS